MAAPRPDSAVTVKEVTLIAEMIRDKLHDLTTRQLQQVEAFIDDPQAPADHSEEKKTT